MADENAVLAVMPERIRLRMERLELRPEAVAVAVGSSGYGVRKWAHGGCAPNCKYLPALSRVLKCSPLYLLGMRSTP